MPRHSHDDLLRALAKGDLAPVYYLFGTEEVLKDEAVRAVIDRALPPEQRDFNLDQRSAQTLTPEDLHTLVNTLPMMADRRVVVIRDVETWQRKAGPREVLEKYLEHPATETILVLVENAPGDDRARNGQPDEKIASRGYAVAFEPLAPDRVARWLAYHAKRLGFTFGDGAAEHLAAATDYELGALRSELEKLAALPDEGPITRDRVGELVGVRHGETLEDWVQTVIADDAAGALGLGRRVLEQAGMSGVKMVAVLGTTLVGLRLARAHYDNGSRGTALERALFDRLRQVRPFGLGDWKVVTRAWAEVVDAWPAARLRRALRATLEADMALKGTRLTDEAGTITNLVLRLASWRHGRGRRDSAPYGPTIVSVPSESP
ncbi:MAG TPA: DNA polymerase III subunit delta [Gemmatimonadales bacterium]|nr:DNA polymerase III subunit delta [Gemmatimonadales bacterium]